MVCGGAGNGEGGIEGETKDAVTLVLFPSMFKCFGVFLFSGPVFFFLVHRSDGHDRLHRVRLSSTF